MTHSTVLKLKISKMKKKLSDYRWSTFAIILSITGLLITLGLCLYSVTISRNFGEVSLDIPIAQVQFEDPTLKITASSSSSHLIDSLTAILVLTEKSFLLSNLDALTNADRYEENVEIIRHVDGEPDLGNLKNGLEKYKVKSSRANGRESLDEVLVVYPTSALPMPIVIQVINFIKSSHLFSHVVLAGGTL